MTKKSWTIGRFNFIYLRISITTRCKMFHFLYVSFIIVKRHWAIQENGTTEKKLNYQLFIVFQSVYDAIEAFQTDTFTII